MTEKLCRICGLPFMSKSSRHTICSRDHYANCPVCGQRVLWKYPNEPVRACSEACRRVRAQQTSIERYGVADAANTPAALAKRRITNIMRYGTPDAGNTEAAKAKRAQTNMGRYGVVNGGASEQAKAKRAATNMERYGVENAMQSPEIQERSRQGVMRKYGVDNPRRAKECIEKLKRTCQKKYGADYAIGTPKVRVKSLASIQARFSTDNAMKDPMVRIKARNTNIQRYGVAAPFLQPFAKEKSQQAMMIKYGVQYPGQSQELRARAVQSNLERHGHPYPLSGQISKLNRDFAEQLAQHGVHPQLEFHISGYSYDMCIESLKTVVELDPTYTHNAVGNHWGKGIESNYHKKKSDAAVAAGYRCIHVFDWDSIDKIILHLAPRESIYARKCHVECIPETGAKDFCDRYHFQGSCRGQKVCYGLFYQGELVQLMTFGKPRYNKNYQWELLRLCTKFGVTVVGGAQRLWSHFINEHHPDSVISYCDLSKFTGDVYERLGFKLLRVNTPKKIWSKGTEYMTETFVNQRGFDQIFGANFGKGTNNTELMLQHDWLPVYDCGQAVYVWESAV